MPRRKPLEILFRDDDIIVVNKPSGILSVPGRDPVEGSLLHDLRGVHENILPVHRLDRDTSGLNLFALNAGAQRHLSEQFSRREVVKKYYAIVIGRPTEDEFAIDYRLEIGRDHLVRISGSGKHARTECRVVERFASFSLLEVRPTTGRQHQIRVHLAAIGHSLAVDPDYGSSDPITILQIKARAQGTRDTETPALLRRTPLHAHRLVFRHPVNDHLIDLMSEVPKDIRATLQQLRKWGSRVK